MWEIPSGQYVANPELHRQIVGIPMGSNCAPLVADLFLFCYERDIMKDLSSDNQANVILKGIQLNVSIFRRSS